MNKSDNKTHPEAETAAREEATIKWMLATPPKLHKHIGKKRVESHSK